MKTLKILYNQQSIILPKDILTKLIKVLVFSSQIISMTIFTSA